jgi:hypothetical protein
VAKLGVQGQVDLTFRNVSDIAVDELVVSADRLVR